MSTSQKINKSFIKSNDIRFNTKYIISTIDDLLKIHPANNFNEIILGNNIYEIDSNNLDISGYTLKSTVTVALHGISQAMNKISTTDSNSFIIHTTANLFIYQLALENTANNSQCIIMDGASGFESLDMKYVEFSSNSKYGTLNGIRQGYWSDGFSINAREGFTCTGTWLGGFTLLNSRIINTGNFILGGDLTLSLNSIRSNMNATIAAGDVAYDFDDSNFNLDGGFQLENGRYEGTGKMVTDFITGNFTEAEKSTKSFFKGNVGNLSKNTVIGGYWKCSSEVVTPLTLNNITKLLGTTVYENLVHIGGFNNNEFTHLNTNTFIYKIDGNIVIDGSPNDQIKLTIRKFNSTSLLYEDIVEYIRNISNLIGPNDVAIFRPFHPNIELSINDRIELWVTNLTDNTNVTMEQDSYIYIEKL